MEFYKYFIGKNQVFQFENFNIKRYDNLFNILEPYKIYHKIISVEINHNEDNENVIIYKRYKKYKIDNKNFIKTGKSSKILKNIINFYIYPENISIGKNFVLHLDNNSTISIKDGKVYVPNKGFLNISSIDLCTGTFHFN